MAPARRLEDALARRGGWVEALRGPALLFALVVRARRAAYDRGFAPRVRVGVPVVSIGNLTTGGTGKTPMCAWVVRSLERRGLRVGLLSRGYGAESGARNDEALLLERLLPGVPHVQDKDRARGAQALVELGVDAIVLDDGFQHRRLARDVDLVLVDATRPFGLASLDGKAPVRALLPRGLLREPPSSLLRADAIVLTRCEQVDGAKLVELERELGSIAPGVPIARAEHRAARFVDADGRAHELAWIRGREVDLASGLGHPAAFEASVRALGALVREHRVFPDHHAFARGDLDGFGSARPLVVSAKDAVKLAPLGVPFTALEIELAFASSTSALEALLESRVRKLDRSALHAGTNG